VRLLPRELDDDLRNERSQIFPGLRVAIGRIAEDAIEVLSGVRYRTLQQLLGLFAIVHVRPAKLRPLEQPALRHTPMPLKASS
jgi:hypothetical protein